MVELKCPYKVVNYGMIPSCLCEAVVVMWCWSHMIPLKTAPLYPTASYGQTYTSSVVIYRLPPSPRLSYALLHQSVTWPPGPTCAGSLQASRCPRFGSLTGFLFDARLALKSDFLHKDGGFRSKSENMIHILHRQFKWARCQVFPDLDMWHAQPYQKHMGLEMSYVSHSFHMYVMIFTGYYFQLLSIRSWLSSNLKHSHERILRQSWRGTKRKKQCVAT